jgi:capsular polysaccharide biosynthesis protein
MIRIEVTLNTCKLSDLKVSDKHGKQISFSARRVLPKLYSYQKLEVLTNDDMAQSPNWLNRSVVRWVIRDVIKNFSFVMHSIWKTYQIRIKEDYFIEFPITVLAADGSKPWVARGCIAQGIRPTLVNEFLEIYRSRNPLDFSFLVRNVKSSRKSNGFNLYENEKYEYLYENNLNPTKFELSYSLYANARILHGRLAIRNNQILQVSNKRLELAGKSPTFVEETSNGFKVLKTHFSAPPLPRAIFLGNDFNLYHFLVECLIRLVTVPEIIYRGIPVVIEKETHPNLIEFAEILTGAVPVLVSPSESVQIGELILCREHGVKDPNKVLERIDYLPELAKRIIKNTPMQPLKIDAKKIFLRRKKRLGRPLQNEDEIYSLLKEFGFHSFYPEEVTASQIVNLLQNCEILVAEAGAALTNLMFMKPNSTLVQLISAEEDSAIWEAYSKIFQINYHQIMGSKKRVGKNGIAFDGYNINSTKFVDSIQRFL